jgi:hypothetical protein
MKAVEQRYRRSGFGRLRADFLIWMAGKRIAKTVEHSARCAEQKNGDASDGTEYFDFVCNVCHAILMTFQRLGRRVPKPNRRALFRPLPRCGERNICPASIRSSRLSVSTAAKASTPRLQCSRHANCPVNSMRYSVALLGVRWQLITRD